MVGFGKQDLFSPLRAPGNTINGVQIAPQECRVNVWPAAGPEIEGQVGVTSDFSQDVNGKSRWDASLEKTVWFVIGDYADGNHRRSVRRGLCPGEPGNNQQQ